jgi:type I restriction enzyme S subunit
MLGDYHYEDVVFIGFDIDNFEDVFKLSEKVNFILVSKNGEIKVKSRVRRFKESPLGRIPEEWEVVELRENISVLLSNVDKKIFNFEQKIFLCNYLDVYKNEYINNSISFMRGSANRREIKKFGVSKGNVIITKDSEEFNDIAKSVYVRDEINNLICGYHLALLKPSKRIDGLYLSKILKLYKVNSFFQSRANGITRFGISKETIEKALISLPTLPEQKRVASVLSQIDETIEKEQKYKQKLEQIKQGLMENLLTGKVRVNHLIKEGVESV